MNIGIIFLELSKNIKSNFPSKILFNFLIPWLPDCLLLPLIIKLRIMSLLQPALSKMDSSLNFLFRNP